MKRPLADITNRENAQASKSQKGKSRAYIDHGNEDESAFKDKLEGAKASSGKLREDEEIPALTEDAWQLDRQLMEVGEDAWYSMDGMQIIRHKTSTLPSRPQERSVLTCTPLRWLQKAQDFLCSLSRLRGVERKRIDAIKRLQLPEFILLHGEQILDRMLSSLMNGDDLVLTAADMANDQSIGSDRATNGVYVRFGIGAVDDFGTLYGARIVDLCKDGPIIPRYHYIGESSDMHRRAIAHTMSAILTTAPSYRWDSSVKAVLQLPVLILEQKDVIDGYTSADIRYLVEGILIAAFGSFTGFSTTYDEMHRKADLDAKWYPGANARGGMIHRHNLLPLNERSLNVNPSLRPLHSHMVNAYLRQASLLGIVPKDSDLFIQAGNAVEAASQKYKDEKVRLLRTGSFTAVLSSPEQAPSGNLVRYALCNFFAIGIREADLTAMLRLGIAVEQEDGRYCFQLRLTMSSASDRDFFIRTHPDNYDLVQGIQLVAHRGGKEMALTSIKGEPTYPLIAGRQETMSAMLMQLFVTLNGRQHTLSYRSLPWWKRREDAKRATPESVVAKLTEFEVQLLDGTIRFHNWANISDKNPEQRMYLKPSEHVHSVGQRPTLVSIATDQFSAQNPQCNVSEPVYCQVKLSMAGNGELRFGGRSSHGISSSQIPFAMRVWSRTTGWHMLTLQCLGGRHLLEILGGLVQKFSLTVRTQTSAPPPMLASQNAPSWINFNAKVCQYANSALFLRACIKRSVREGGNDSSYNLVVGRRVEADAMLVKDEIVRMHIEFWDHSEAQNYRLLLQKQEQTDWHLLKMSPSLLSDLEAYRDRHHS